MCGIAGVYAFGGEPADGETIRRMMEAQRHRGPDDDGARLFSLRSGTSKEIGARTALGPEAGLEGGVGFNRLSILDLSPNGHQPMCNADESVFVAFNGEIYNAFDYRAELERAGYGFRSTTDTEIVLHLYEEHGIEGLLERLNGMFALCIVDLRERALYLVRDRLGIKPMYWFERDGRLLFASEIKSLLQHPMFVARIDEAALDEQLAFGQVVGEATLLEGVRLLPPGHWMRITADGRGEPQPYWQLPTEPATARQSLAESAEQVRELLETSVRRRLLADVKVGLELSGGVDSSLIADITATAVGADIDAVSVTLENPWYSEEQWIEAAARNTNIKVHSTLLTASSFVENFATATWHRDTPLSLPHQVAVFSLGQAARDTVTVLLCGEGADELFGGYPRFFHAALRGRLGPLLPLLDRHPGLRRRLAMLHGVWNCEDPRDAFITSSAALRTGDLRSLRPEADPDALLARRRAIFGEPGPDFIADCRRYELRTGLIDLLMRQDKMTMAHSVETRVPFLDHELVEHAFRLPSKHMVTARPRRANAAAYNSKMLLKHLARDRFGESFAYRKKVGLAIPLADFLREPAFMQLVEGELLPSMRERSLVDTTVVERWWRDSVSGDTDADMRLWAPIAIEQWARLFLDDGPPTARPVERLAHEPAALADSDHAHA